MTTNVPRKAPASPSHGLFTVASMMRRIRVEASLRNARDLGVLASYTSEPFSMPGWNSSESCLGTKPQYELPELLRASDTDFVRNAYRAILRRPADAKGLENYVTQLRTGGMDKVDVLAALRWSQEGVTHSVHVNGLLAPHLLRKWGRWPVVGPLLRWMHAALTLHRHAGQLQQAENVLACDVQDLGRYVGTLGDKFGGTLERHEDTLAILDEQVQQLRQERRLAVLANQRQWQQLESVVAALRQELALQVTSLDSQSTRVDAHDTRLEAHAARLDTHQVWLDAQDARQAHEDLLRARSREIAEQLDTVYADFEEEFRGSRELVRARLTPYIGLLQEASKGGTDEPILDLGAGRGEWLQLLHESGLVARGVDTNARFVAFCQQLGLDVENNDALKALESLAPASLGAVTTMHLVEHLAFEDVVALIDGSFRALRPGGMLIIETPNPENLRVASHNFYLDPTHRNPLPPIMMRWLVENRGFKDATIHRLSEHRPWPILPRVPESSEAAASINPLLDWAEVAPDYAIVARKSND